MIKNPCLAVGIASILITSQGAMLYVGPGAGLTAIGSALALVGGVFLTIVGFVYYPLKRWIRRRRTQKRLSGETPVT